jgi:hypothetical protein
MLIDMCILAGDAAAADDDDGGGCSGCGSVVDHVLLIFIVVLAVSIFNDSSMMFAFLSGCDYLPNVPGTGIMRAHALIRQHGSAPAAITHMMSNDKKKHIKRPDPSSAAAAPSTTASTTAASPTWSCSYISRVQLARLTFLHQVVCDPQTGHTLHLTPLPENPAVSSRDLEFACGALLPPPISSAVCITRLLNPKTHQPWTTEAPHLFGEIVSPSKSQVPMTPVSTSGNGVELRRFHVGKSEGTAGGARGVKRARGGFNFDVSKIQVIVKSQPAPQQQKQKTITDVFRKSASPSSKLKGNRNLGTSAAAAASTAAAAAAAAADAAFAAAAAALSRSTASSSLSSSSAASAPLPQPPSSTIVSKVFFISDSDDDVISIHSEAARTPPTSTTSSSSSIALLEIDDIETSPSPPPPAPLSRNSSPPSIAPAIVPETPPKPPVLHAATPSSVAVSSGGIVLPRVQSAWAVGAACLKFHADEEVEDDEPAVVGLEAKQGVRLTASPAAEVTRASAGHVTSAATAQKQNKRRSKCVGDVPVVPITRYFAASSPAAATLK